jgi:hypothetical protein
VITAVWPDGQVIWSRDDLNGGPPYFQGRIDRQALRTMLADLETTGAFTASYVRTNNFGPDSYCTGIFMAQGAKTFMSRSWHELVEQNPNLMAASSGLTSLKGQTRGAFLKSDDPEYQKYRRLWGEVRSRIRTLVPQNGEELGNVEFKLAKRTVPLADTGDAIPRQVSVPQTDLDKAVPIALARLAALGKLEDDYKLIGAEQRLLKGKYVWLITFKPVRFLPADPTAKPIGVGGEIFVTVDLETGRTVVRYGE